jgi:DNA-binding NarL/FixJ family response regulator
MNVQPHILIAADHRVVVRALTKLLEPHFHIVGTAYNARELLDLAAQCTPDLVILDKKMLPSNGRNTTEQLKQLVPCTKQIVLSMSDDAEVGTAGLQKWVSGLIDKRSAGTALTRVIRRVLKAKAGVPPRMAQRAFDRFVRDLRTDREKSLTPRQREVLQLLAEGRTMKEAADTLHITTRTIAFHKYRMMEAFGLETNSDLFRFALAERVITAA